MNEITPKMRKLFGRSNHPCHKHAAMVFRGGNLVSSGSNHETVHAEVQALKKLWPDHRAGTTVVSIRMTRGGVLGMAKPCAACEKFMREAGVKKVIYSNALGQMEKMRL
jgi:cytidine deaminase